MPARQPEYRRNRPHVEFIANLQIDAGRVRAGLIEAWDAKQEFGEVPWAAIDELARAQYRRSDWLQKF
jgi:lipoate-protein ligase A